MTRPYAEVIGDPVAHSRSPTIHRFWLDALGIAAEYHATRVPRTDLPDHLAQRRADPSWRGSNVTMPLKLDALTLADEATDRAATAGAANILLPREGRVFAANSDVGALVTLLERQRAAGRPTEHVTLFGTGGAARAALVACRIAGVKKVRIQARDLAAARALAVEFQVGIAPEALPYPVSGDGLINATPLGMAGHDCLNCDLSGLDPRGWVIDMVTDPLDTPLLKAARAQGLATADGLAMLVEQAAASFKLFFDAEPPRERDDALLAVLRG